MGFEEDMIEYGYTSEYDYLDSLYNEAENGYRKQEEWQKKNDEYEEWIASLSTEEIDEIREAKRKKQRDYENKRREESADRALKQDELITWAKSNIQLAQLFFSLLHNDPQIYAAPPALFIQEFTYSCENDSVYLYKKREDFLKIIKEREIFIRNNKQEWDDATNDYIDELVNNIILYRYNYGLIAHIKGYKYPIHHNNIEENIYKFLQRWIHDNPAKWAQDIRTCNFTAKQNAEYQYRSWVSHFSPLSTYTIWREENKTDWLLFKKRTKNKCSLKLKDEWIKSHKHIWNGLMSSNAEAINIHINRFKEYLRCLYMDMEWNEYSNKKWKIETEKRRDELLSIKNPKFDIEDWLDDDFDDNRKEEKWTEDLEEELNFLEELLDSDDFTSYKMNSYDPYGGYLKYTRNCKEFHDMQDLQFEIDKYINNFYASLTNESKKEFINSNIQSSIIEDTINGPRDRWPNYMKNSTFFTPSDYAKYTLLEEYISTHKSTWYKWKYKQIWYSGYKYNSQIMNDPRPDPPFYDSLTNYNIWKRRNKSKWQAWLRGGYKDWKEKAQCVDQWISWLVKGNWREFDNWACKNIRQWNSWKSEFTEDDYFQICSSLFNFQLEEYKRWKKTKPNEWKLWEPILRNETICRRLDLEWLKVYG